MATLDIVNIGQKIFWTTAITDFVEGRYSFLVQIISSVGSQPNLVNNITELSWKLASSIILAHWVSVIITKMSHTVQQYYSRIGFMRELYKLQVRYFVDPNSKELFPYCLLYSLTLFKNILMHIKVVGNSCFFHRDYKYHWSKFNPRHKWRAFLIPSYRSALSKYTPHNYNRYLSLVL